MKEHTAIEWGTNYCEALKRTAVRRRALRLKRGEMQPLAVPSLFSAFTKAKRRLILCAYEDVLEPHWATATLKWRRDGGDGKGCEEGDAAAADGVEEGPGAEETEIRAERTSATSLADLRDARYTTTSKVRVHVVCFVVPRTCERRTSR